MITAKNTILKITAGKAEDGFSAEIVSENIKMCRHGQSAQKALLKKTLK